MDYRLKRQCDLNEVFKKGKRLFSKSVTVIILPKPNVFKFGVSVSKKHGNAVTRNRIKRLIRAVVLPFLPDFKDCYIVFLPKTGMEHTFNQFSYDILQILKKENIIK